MSVTRNYHDFKVSTPHKTSRRLVCTAEKNHQCHCVDQQSYHYQRSNLINHADKCDHCQNHQQKSPIIKNLNRTISMLPITFTVLNAAQHIHRYQIMNFHITLMKHNRCHTQCHQLISIQHQKQSRRTLFPRKQDRLQNSNRKPSSLL